ncbi:MAG: hypothetical protein JNM66_20005 [Bryobacterales bacterium]|nr:hypothetical protein [Bryobacterales bacterium]
MRRVMIAVLAVAGLAGCMKSKKPVQYVEEGGSQLSSAVNVADPRTAIQLLRGFHDVENNAWRWTASQFTVALRPPKDTPAEGVMLYLEYSVPEVFLAKVPATTLSIAVNGQALEPEKISKAGTFKLERAVTPAMLQSDVVKVEFALDKFVAAGVVDQRELGLIVSAVGLQGAKPAAK